MLISSDTGYATQIIDATGARTVLTHDSSGLLREMTDVRGFVHEYGYNELGHLTSDTSPGLEAQTMSGYPMAGVAHLNGEQERSSFTVALDQVSGVTTRTALDSDGSATTQSVDRRAQRTQTSSDGTVVESTFFRHPTHKMAVPVLTSRTTRLPSGLTRSESHSLERNGAVWTETFGVNGHIATTVTDQALHTRSTTTAQGTVVTTTLDNQGRPVTVQVGSLEPTVYSYDSMGRLAGINRASRATSLNYFADGTGDPEAGHLQSIVDAENHTIGFTRDAFGRALSSTLGGDTLDLGYSSSGSLEQLTTAMGNTHLQNFNGVNLMTEYVAPSAESTDSLTQYTYDNARRLSSTSLPGSIGVIQSRDPVDPVYPERQGRLRSISSPNSGNGTSPFEVHFAYADEVECLDPGDPETCQAAGPAGQLSSLTRGDVQTALTYDGAIVVAQSHVIAPGSTTGLASTAYSRTLNTGFQTSSDKVSAEGVTVSASYGYDGDQRLVCAGAGLTCSESDGILYEFDGHAGDGAVGGHGLLEGTVSGSVTEQMQYNAFGELARHTQSVAGQPVIVTTYDEEGSPRDNVGRVVHKTVERGGASQATEYFYDAKGRLSAVAATGKPTKTYKYDSNGNRLCSYEAPLVDCETEAEYNSQDRLRYHEGVEYLYTDRGSLFQRVASSGLETFTYDALGNLTRVQQEGGPTIDYPIDAQGRRVGKRVDGVLQSQYVWSNQLRIEAELDGSGKVTSRFVYGNRVNVPDLIVKPAAAGSGEADRIYRVLTDALGSPLYVVNLADPTDVLLDASYDEWGDITSFTSPTGVWPIPFGFAGGLYDADTELVRFGARDYDPRIGRWTSKDPIGFGGGQANLYVYVGNSPNSATDHTGLYVDIYIWDPVGLGSSSFGHISVEINGVHVSFGPVGNLVSDNSYATRNEQFRGADILSLNVSAEQEELIFHAISSNQGDYNIFTNNCGDPIESALEGLGIGLGTNILPNSLRNSIIESGIVGSSRRISTINP